MDQRIKRRTGDKISVLGMGTGYLADVGKSAVDVLRCAYEGGINYYDLATSYCVLLKGRWRTMRDYMRALQERFNTPSQRTNRLEKKAAKACRRLNAKLSKSERKLLLRLADLEDELRENTSLDSFIAGYRLAQGIQQELAPQYSFENESERLACEMAEREAGE